MKVTFPFTALVGQEQMKSALVLNAINPKLAGVLIRGEKGTAKSTAVRALAGLLPEIDVVENCVFGCDPDQASKYCPQCKLRLLDGPLHRVTRRTKVVELPINATEDRVVGTLDLEHALKHGEKRFEPGVLAEAHRGILYVDEVNLLDDHIVDVLLDSAAMGVNTVEREGVSYTHPAEFILVGTMNPEEGDLRPQLLDRFGLCVAIFGVADRSDRVEIVKRWSAYEEDPENYRNKWEDEENKLAKRILNARDLLPKVKVSDKILNKIAQIAIEIGVDGHRADLIMMKSAKTMAAFHGRDVVSEDDVVESAELALYHRVRRKPFEDVILDMDMVSAVMRGKSQMSASGKSRY